MPSSWDGANQGYVTRKYDYTAVDLFLFDKQNRKAFIVTLTCFILCNIMTMYVLLRQAPLIYTRLSKAAIQNGYQSSIAKGSLVLVAVLVSVYLLTVICAYSTEPAMRLTPQCDSNMDRYGCIPKDEFPTVHRTQVLSLVSSFSLLLIAIILYSIGSVYTVKTSVCSVFQGGCVKWIEAYLLWNALMGIHITIGLAGIPLLIFTIFDANVHDFLPELNCYWILLLMLLPFAAVFHIN